MLEGFDILVNGVPRTFRDDKKIAVAAGQTLRLREKGAEIILVDRRTKAWVAIVDTVATPTTWNPGPYLSDRTSRP